MSGKHMVAFARSTELCTLQRSVSRLFVQFGVQCVSSSVGFVAADFESRRLEYDATFRLHDHDHNCSNPW